MILKGDAKPEHRKGDSVVGLASNYRQRFPSLYTASVAYFRMIFLLSKIKCHPDSMAAKILHKTPRNSLDGGDSRKNDNAEETKNSSDTKVSNPVRSE